MEPPLHQIGIPHLMFMVLLSYLLIFPADAIAQDQTSGGGNQLQSEQEKEKIEIQEKEQASSVMNPRTPVAGSNSDGDYTTFEYDQMWNRNPNPNPEWDFRLYEQGTYAGDINGDNLNDFIVTDSLESKTAVFFGGTSKEPNDIVAQELIPVGDLNGDGYADAVAVDNSESNSVEIYEGTESGYSATGVRLDLNPAEFNILGFVDFNRDGSDDIYAYSRESEGLILVFGQENFADITVEASQEVLSNYPKKVVAKDIDQDDLVEIVEFQGIFGDGHIQILEVGDVELSFTPEEYSSFPFNSFPEEASDTDLHLIDVNGNGQDDIYISLGRDSPKYIMEYDSETGTYNSETEIIDGELVPAGDLNNDGRHDFIMGDPDDSHDPYIAYGSEDLPSNISLDVELEGDSGDNWSWEMEYNPYSGFGDLNGDEIDDALLSHTETDDEDVYYGRRIVPGHRPEEELSSGNSEFQLYPREYFFNRIYEVEELGDVNNDGVDDFAMVLQDQGKVEIYHGGSSISESPDQSFNSGYYLNAITRGDFTGDGISDIVTISQGLEGLQIEVFEGGRSFTRIQSINVSEFQDAEYNDVSGVNNIGDINGDGNSDFLVGSGAAGDTTDNNAYLHEAYIFYGGSSISSTPDDNLDMDPSNNFISVKIDAAESATALGDLDGDGKDDFAVGSPRKGEYGEVVVYHDISDEPIRFTSSTGYYFGSDLVSGDFNGDGLKDLAVSVAYSETVAEIYYGREDFNTEPDRSLAIPDFLAAESEVDYMLPSLETITDFNNDGKDELLVGSAGFVNNAALFPHIDSNEAEANLIQAPNQNAALGGNRFINKYGTMATGDFTSNEELDVIISQYDDNSDGISTSRVYRYALNLPITIISVEDVPEDQGGEVRINIGGELLESTPQFDSLEVQLKTEKEWQTVFTDTDPGTNSYDVPVPETQPTNTEDVDNSYTFRIVAFTDTVYARSQEATGRAFDNIPPPQVHDVDVSAEDQDSSTVLNWPEVDAPDVGTYLVYTTDDEGRLSEAPIDTTEETSYTLPDHFEGIRTFAVSALDDHNNEGEISAFVNVVFPQVVEYANQEGWSLIGLPVEADTDSIQSLLEDPELTIYEYDRGYKQASELKRGKGYWAKFADTDIRTLEGLPFTEFSVELEEGWNLISGAGGDIPVESIEDPDEIIIPGTFYSFDEGYLAADTLRPTKGYWIRTDSAGTVTLTHPKFIERERTEVQESELSLAKTDKDITDAFNKVTISDDEHSAELYFGQKMPKGIDKRRYTLPPMPPGDVFDARFEGDRRLIGNDKVDIRLKTISEKPAKMKIEAGTGAEERQFVIKEFSDGEFQAKHTVNDSEEITLKHKETDSITLTPMGVSELGQQEIPDEFDLEQNYPNPFTRNTQIRYSVAEARDVKIDVFNILGRRIVTLVNRRQEPGTYEITFDGSDLASGIYLYRLQAGDFISTKKFILAK